MQRYQRPSPGSLKTKDKKLRTLLKREDEKYRAATASAADLEALHTERSGFLEPENEMEQTFKVKQKDIVDAVDVSSKSKRFTLKLDQLGPYTANYSITGNHLLLSGRRGHVASMNWKTGELGCELFLNETVHCGTFMQNDYEFFAVAQKKHTYIYDQFGAEVHELKHHIGATHLEYLPYHYLLVSAGTSGYLKYQDVSTGELVAELRTALGPTSALAQNRYNAVIHAGHRDGEVTLWAPSMPTPLARIQSSRGAVRAIAIDRGGHYMAVSGQDRTMKIWDIRQFRCVHEMYTPTPASSLSISESGLLAAGWGPHVQIWKDALQSDKPKPSAPYMNHLVAGQQVESVKFCPYEDVLGVGVSTGFESLLVPGSGEAQIDALAANPYSYSTRTTRREGQVRALLEKLQPDMITLDPNEIGVVDRRSAAERQSAAAKEAALREKEAEEQRKLRARPNVKRGNSALRRLLRKKKRNVIDQHKVRLEHAFELEEQARKQASGKPSKGKRVEGAALQRFT